MDTPTIAFALGAAVFLGAGFVVQQHVAAQEPPEERLSFRILISLARRPLWLGGIGCMVVGQLLGAAALGTGSLARVEPIVGTNLLFALSMSAAWRRCRLGLKEWLGAAALVGGLAAFIVAGNPHGGNAVNVPPSSWGLGAGGILLTAAVFVLIGKNAWEPRQATLLAGAAGTLYGLQDALTTRTIAQWQGASGGGLLGVLSSWPVYTLVAVAVVALMLGQSAFEAAPLDASLPAMAAAEPITAIGLGAGLYAEYIATSAVALGVEIAGIAAMVVGVYLVATSAIVTRSPTGPVCRDQTDALAGIRGGLSSEPAPPRFDKKAEGY